MAIVLNRCQGNCISARVTAIESDAVFKLVNINVPKMAEWASRHALGIRPLRIELRLSAFFVEVLFLPLRSALQHADI